MINSGEDANDEVDSKINEIDPVSIYIYILIGGLKNRLMLQYICRIFGGRRGGEEMIDKFN